jgi:CO/xanthine dehydrogenase Mo-binding subunit
MTDFKAIGRPTPIIDGPAKVTGAIRYAPDVQLPGLLHIRLVTSIHAHANIRAIETASALEVPGVAAVLTAKDLPNIPPSSRSRLLLARGRVMFVGQPVALVLATSEAAAEDGVGQVTVDYEPLPAAITLDDALAEGAPLVWPNGVPDASGEAGAHGADAPAGGGESARRERSNVSGEETFTRGDVAQGFAGAEVVVEKTFTTPMVHQSSIETHCIIAQPNPINNGVVMWASTQGHFDVRREVAGVLGAPETDVRVTAMPVGGGFGGKFGLYEPLVALAARAVNRPVRLALTRSEELLATHPAPPMKMRVRLGAKRDGALTALEGDVYVDNGCYPFGIAGFFAYMLGSFYRAPNMRVRGIDVLTFKMSAGAYRAPGAPCLVYALDSAMDELARRLNLDPLEFRLLNASRPGDPMADGEAWAGMGMSAVLEAVRDHPIWKNREAARAQGRGVGLAVGGWPGGSEPAAAVCSMDRDGVLQLHVGSVDLNGTLTGFALIAAEEFGIAPEKVRVVFSDTDTAPYSGATGGSKVTFSTGGAVIEAAREAKRQVLEIAAEILEAAVEDLEIVDGAVQVRGAPSKAIKLSKISEKIMRYGGRYAPIFAQGRFAQKGSAPAFNAQVVEVEVDRETGEVHLHRLAAAQDVGRAINPLAVEGQMMGGAVQGIGWALYENMQHDSQGQLLTGTWLDYAVPHSIQTPPIETIIVEVPSETGPFGARGVGEAAVVPTAAAIANAIADATGARLTDLPMTAPRVLAALNSSQ